VSENLTIKGLVFVPKSGLGTNCGCDLFQLLLVLKLLKFGFRSKTG